MLMKTTIHSQENNCFQEPHNKIPVFSEKGDIGKNLKAAQRDITGKHFLL